MCELDSGLVDNFHVVENEILKFDRQGEFYLVLILKRRKDAKGAMPEGVNEDNRLIKHFFVYDVEYFRRKRDAIRQLCAQNGARAYILPQRRSCRRVLWALHDKISETLRNGTENSHFDHLIRSCVAGTHDTEEKRYKRWVIDIDADDAETVEIAHRWCERIANGNNPPAQTDRGAAWELAYDLAWRIRAALVPETANACCEEEARVFMPKVSGEYSKSDISLLDTPHGFHIVTPPFNRDEKALRRYLGGDFLPQKWIKPDAMALVYSLGGIGGGEK